MVDSSGGWLVLAATPGEHRTTFVLVQAAPDTERFTDLQCVLTALLHHRAGLTDLFCLRLADAPRRSTLVVGVKEDS